MIGTVTRNFDEKIGVRLYDTKTREFKDCPIGGVAQYLAEGNKVQNIAIQNGKVQCTNGEFNRYATIVLGIGVAGKSPLVVTRVLADGTYMVVNGQGESANMGLAYLIKYDRTDGIANGRIAPDSSGKPTLVPYTPGAQFEADRVIDRETQLERFEQKMEMIDSDKYTYENGKFIWLDETASVLDIPNGLIELTYGTFSKCSSGMKRTLILPKSIKIIGTRAFEGLNGITELKLPSGITTIGTLAFNGTSIRTVHIPPTVTTIMDHAFTGVSKVIYYNRQQKRIIDRILDFGTQVVYKPWKGQL